MFGHGRCQPVGKADVAQVVVLDLGQYTLLLLLPDFIPLFLP